ncbi:hypothetical protein WUBG_19063 [Wuchereria bancrofti]|uniref:Uncharacterized protein n=1 Tax=Wuchereria bancrofti TaxID=6293 RepID=J9DKB7_WUCBA|nr:hypothetical protein WUBG_19063 [Wuchereria bancrofti]
MDNSYYAARGIPPPTSGPVPLRGISPTLDFRFRDRYADYGRYGGPIRLSSLHPRPSPYDRPYYDRDRYYRYGARYDPEFDEAMYDPTVKVFMRCRLWSLRWTNKAFKPTSTSIAVRSPVL